MNFSILLTAARAIYLKNPLKFKYLNDGYYHCNALLNHPSGQQPQAARRTFALSLFSYYLSIKV
jgi:hypothetical protein